MANYSYIGYAPDVISVNFVGQDTITLAASYSPGTDRRVFDVQDDAGGTILNGANPLPDDGTIFNGDRFNNENGDDATQTGVVTSLDGSTTFDSGDIYLEESYILTVPGGGNITVYAVEIEGTLVGYITSEPLDPGVTYDIQVVNVTPTNAPDTSDPTAIIDVPCFVSRTLITTPSGPKPIESLSAGDLVCTADHGDQPIRWIGACQLDQAALAAKPKLRPIRIEAGALGSGLPRRDLLVSPQHRMLVRSPIATRMFDAAEVLVPAHMLTELPGIDCEDTARKVTYYHMLFDRHEVVFAEGAPSESLFTGPQAMRSLPSAARAEILELFPFLRMPGYVAHSARRIPSKGRQVRNMVQRHLKNDRSLV